MWFWTKPRVRIYSIVVFGALTAGIAITMAILLCSLAWRGLAESVTNALTPAQELATFHLADERLVVWDNFPNCQLTVVPIESPMASA